jgi:hypothetical protein
MFISPPKYSVAQHNRNNQDQYQYSRVNNLPSAALPRRFDVYMLCVSLYFVGVWHGSISTVTQSDDDFLNV